jgi:hypothetical protein
MIMIPDHDPQFLTIHRLLCISRVLLKLRRVDGLQLRAAETANGLSNSTRKLIECSENDVWLSLSSKLVDVACEVVALCEARGVEDAAGQVCDVDSSE